MLSFETIFYELICIMLAELKEYETFINNKVLQKISKLLLCIIGVHCF